MAAIDRATAGLTPPGWLNDSFELLAVRGLIVALGDLGRIDAIAEPVARGYPGSAAGGVTSEAIALARESATRVEKGGCPAQEVFCLQTAAQFGDATVATRLHELASIVQGPRVVAAAQAASVFRFNYRGAALTAVSRRLAEEYGADTPSVRANATPIPLTARQREIIALAATGLSNRDIAARLVMSVRTVEGHLFRGSQKPD